MKIKYMALNMMMVSLLMACQQTEMQNTAPASSASAPQQKASLLERIQNKGTIVVATEGNYAPFTYHDKDSQQLTGYDVEVVRALADKLGVTVEFRELKWVGILPSVESGEIDMAANQISLSSPERQAIFDKAEPYSWSGISILTRKDDERIKQYEDMKGLRAAQVTTSSYGEQVAKAGGRVHPSESMYQSANLVRLKEVDFTLNNSLAVLHYLKQSPDADMKVAWTSPTNEKKGSGIVMLKGNPEVLAKVNEAMSELKADGTLKRLGEQFFGEDVSEQ